MTLHSRPASPDALSNVETDHPHILLPIPPDSLTCKNRLLHWAGTPAYSYNTARANCIPGIFKCLSASARKGQRLRGTAWT